MAAPTPFFSDPQNRRWLWRIVLALLIFGLLAWAVWWYFEWRIYQAVAEGPSG